MDAKRGAALLLAWLGVGCDEATGRFGRALGAAPADESREGGPACSPGMNPGAPVWDGQITLTPTFAAQMHDAGVRTVRLDFRRDGGWDEGALSRYDQILDTLEQAGLTAYGLVTYEAISQSQEQYNDDADGDGINPAVAEYGETFAMLVDRYGGRVRRWELWNEPNCWANDNFEEDPQRAGCTYTLPRVTAHMVVEAYLRVQDRVDDGDIELVLGGLLAHTIGGPVSSGANWLERFYAEGPWDWLEQQTGRRYPWRALGIHPYVDQSGGTDGAHIHDVLDEIEATMDAHGDGAALAVTEIGWATSVGLQTQADNLRTAFEVLRGRPRVDEISWFSLHDAPAHGLHFGVLDDDGAARPVYDALREQTAACQGGVSDGGGEAPPEGDGGGGDDGGGEGDGGEAEGGEADGGDAEGGDDGGEADGGEADGGDADGGGETGGGEADGGGESDGEADGGGETGGGEPDAGGETG